MFSMNMPEAMEQHLELASAAQGLSKGEYVRLALAVSLNAEPIVTPEFMAKARAMRKGNGRRVGGTHDRGRDLVSRE